MAALRDFLKPDLEPGLRPDPVADPDGARYTRTFLWMRLGVGVFGVLLPVLLISLDSIVFNGHPFVRDSMSAYYYSGMREFFVGVIFGSGAFLLAYKVSEGESRQHGQHRCRLLRMAHRNVPHRTSAAQGTSQAATAPAQSAPGPHRSQLGEGDSLRRIRRLHHLPGSCGCALWLSRREIACGS
jgi:hypothetical protein